MPADAAVDAPVETGASAATARASMPPTPDASAAFASTQVHVTDGETVLARGDDPPEPPAVPPRSGGDPPEPPAVLEPPAVGEASAALPSAGAASPTGMVKPPPVTAVPRAAQLAPVLPDEPSLSPPAFGPPAFGPVDGGEDFVRPDDDTAPLPVILPDWMPDQDARPPRMRDPFEPIERPSPPLPRRAPAQETTAATTADPATASSVVGTPSAAKMDQIKDLYLTAEAIGDDALATHFQQVSDRQRQLIREYFDQIARNGDDRPKS